jgi:DNA-directed RNA polymerase specialized sigma24 family protein
VDEMTTSEAAATLEISEEALKVRLHRARAMLRKPRVDHQPKRIGPGVVLG